LAPTGTDVGSAGGGVDTRCGFPLFFSSHHESSSWHTARHVGPHTSRPEHAGSRNVASDAGGGTRGTHRDARAAAIARVRDRASEVAADPVAEDAVRAEVGKAGAADRATGTAPRRSATESALGELSGERRSAAIGGNFHPDGYSSEAGTTCAASTSAADDADPSTKIDDLSRLWRRVTETRRRHLRDAGLPASELRGDSSCTAEAELRALRANRAGAGTESADCAWSGWPWTAGPCAGQQILRPSSALSAV